MERRVERIDGIKYNLKGLTDEELEGLHGYALERHRQATDEIGLIETEIFARKHPELPMDGVAEPLGFVALDGQIELGE